MKFFSEYLRCRKLYKILGSSLCCCNFNTIRSRTMFSHIGRKDDGITRKEPLGAKILLCSSCIKVLNCLQSLCHASSYLPSHIIRFWGGCKPGPSFILFFLLLLWRSWGSWGRWQQLCCLYILSSSTRYQNF